MGSSSENESIISKKEKANLVKGKWVLIFSGIALLLFYFYNFFNTTILTQGSAAQFGDYLGGILNPILGFATVTLLVWSIQIQLRELKLTRDEMKKNTLANQEQAFELSEQNKYLKEQNENSLDNLRFNQSLNLLQDKQKSIEELYKKNVFYSIKFKENGTTKTKDKLHSIERYLLHDFYIMNSSGKDSNDITNEREKYKSKINYLLESVEIEYEQYSNYLKDFLICKNITYSQSLNKVLWVKVRLKKLVEIYLYSQEELNKYFDTLKDIVKESSLLEEDKKLLLIKVDE